MSAVGYKTEVWRDALQRHGFTDDGQVLRGLVLWTHPEHGPATAEVEIEPLGFPFHAPRCRLLEAGAPLRARWHLDRTAADGGTGSLYLWEDEYAGGDAPWRDPKVLLARVRDWLVQSALGWPGDTSMDLERYLQSGGGALVPYDAEALAGLSDVAVRTEVVVPGRTVRVTAEVRRHPVPRAPARRNRRDQHLTWIADLGDIEAPITSWKELLAVLGEHAATVERHVSWGVVERLLLRYRHNVQDGALVVRPRITGGLMEIAACESADTSLLTTSLRAGPAQHEALGSRVAIVGCGAIGSFRKGAVRTRRWFKWR